LCGTDITAAGIQTSHALRIKEIAKELKEAYDLEVRDMEVARMARHDAEVIHTLVFHPRASLHAKLISWLWAAGGEKPRQKRDEPRARRAAREKRYGLQQRS
jgi:hypothetical protein